MRPHLVTAMLLSLMLAGCGGENDNAPLGPCEVDDDLRPEGTTGRQATIAPGFAYEWNQQVYSQDETGDGPGIFRWQWRVVEALNVSFDVHYHDGAGSVYVVQMEGCNHTSNVSVHQQGLRSLLWENHGSQSVRVEFWVWGDIPPGASGSEAYGPIPA